MIGISRFNNSIQRCKSNLTQASERIIPYKARSIAKGIVKDTKYPLITINTIGLLGCIFLLGTREKDSQKNSGWNPNIKVMAAVGQNARAMATKSSSYSQNLLRVNSEDKYVKSLEQANDSLMKKGYSVSLPMYTKPLFMVPLYIAFKPFLPAETPNTQLNIFNKDEKNKNRFVLCAYDQSESRFKKSSDKFIQKVQETYNIPAGNIIQVPIDSLKSIEKGLDSLTRKTNALTNKDNTEVLFQYIGHGGAEATKESDKKLEGAMEGEIADGIKEPQLKKLFNEKLGNIKSLLIFDACHSGAWTTYEAENAIKTVTNRG